MADLSNHPDIPNRQVVYLLNTINFVFKIISDWNMNFIF